MKINIKKILQCSMLSLLILLNCSWSPVSISSDTGEPILQNHSSCDEDIKNLGITSEEYAEYDYSLVLLAEVSNQYLVAYMYDKYENFNYHQIDFEYVSASSENYLSSVSTNHIRRDVEVLSTSSDGLIKKILVKDFVIPSDKYRKYIVNQLTSADYEVGTDNSERYKSLAIGTEYIYTTNSDDSLSYKVKAINYVTIQNQVVYHYNIKSDNTHVGKWRWAPKNGSVGSRYGMLGFSAKQLKIEKLEEVEVIYDVYDYRCLVPTQDISLINRYNEENVKRLSSTNSKFKDLTFIEECGEIKTLVKKDVVDVIKPEIISDEKYESYDWFNKKVKNKFWDSILEYKDIDKYFSDKDEEKTKADMKEKFKNDQFILTIFKSEDKIVYNNGLHGYRFYENNFIGNDTDVNKYLIATGAKDANIAVSAGSIYTCYVFESQEISNACVVRLKYLDEFDGVHDVKVISAPVDSSGNIAGGDQTDPETPNWWEELIQAIIVILIIIVCLVVFVPVVAPFIPVILSGISSCLRSIVQLMVNGLRWLVSGISKGFSVVISYIKIGVYKIGEFIASIFHR